MRNADTVSKRAADVWVLVLGSALKKPTYDLARVRAQPNDLIASTICTMHELTKTLVGAVIYQRRLVLCKDRKSTQKMVSVGLQS